MRASERAREKERERKKKEGEYNERVSHRACNTVNLEESCEHGLGKEIRGSAEELEKLLPLPA